MKLFDLHVPPPRPEDEGIPVLLRIPGVLDALLFWSIFASSSVIMLLLLSTTIKNQWRENVQSDIRTQTLLAAEALALQDQTLDLSHEQPERKSAILSRRLERIVNTHATLSAAAIYQRSGSAWTVLARTNSAVESFPLNDPHLDNLLNRSVLSPAPHFSAWEFLTRRHLPLLDPVPDGPEFSAQRLPDLTSRPADSPAKVLVLAYDAPRIHSRFRELDWITASVISLAIVVASMLALLVRIRSMQREVAERQRLEALDLLSQRDAILARVAASADEMFQAKDPHPPCAELLDFIRHTLQVRSAAVCLTSPPRPFSTEPAPPLMISSPLGDTPLSLSDLDRPALSDWRKRLMSSQAITGPLEKLPPAERLELDEMGLSNLAVLPILAEGQLHGLIILLDHNKMRAWDPGLLDTLRLAADVIGAAFRRNEQEQRLTENAKMQALGRMAGGVAHEFNNLLHIISGNLRRLEQTRMTPEQRAELTEKMIETTERGSRIVEQLLSATRQTTPSLRPTQLNDVVQKTILLARPALRRDILLETHLDPRLPLAPMDPDQIQQVILNLLLNANDAINGPGRITITTGQINDPDQKPYIYASVADTGPGIDPRHADHIFDPFFTTKEPGKGTGLGLSTSRGILDLHGGSIVASNQEPHGAVFTFYIPVKVNKTSTQRVHFQPTDRVPVKAGRVLIADDEPLCLDMLRDILQEHQFDCLCASSGEEALELARQHADTIDWVVTDWTMPGLHGRELAAHLRHLLPHAGIIVCSGFVLEDQEIPEINGLMVKPFNPDHLLRLMSQIAEASRSPEAAAVPHPPPASPRRT